MADTLTSLKNLVKDKRVLFLALAPVVTLLLYYFDTNIVSLVFSRLFLFLAIGIFKVSFLGLESSNCNCFNKSEMEANWLNFHNKFNLVLDSIRSAILLHNKTLLLKIIVGLYFASLVGSIFSSVTTLVIIVWFYFANELVEENENLKSLRNTGLNLAGSLLERIPKYRQN